MSAMFTSFSPFTEGDNWAMIVVGVMEDVLGRQLPIDFQPARAGDVAVSQADPAALKSLFPDFEPTPLEAGIRSTVDWFEAARPWEL